MEHRRCTHVLRWIARIWSVASVSLILAFLVGEGVLPSGRNEWLGFLLFPMGVSLGMVLAWWNEAAGGLLTVGSLAGFYALRFLTTGSLPAGLAWLVFAAPGFLFLAAWILSRPIRRSPSIEAGG